MTPKKQRRDYARIHNPVICVCTIHMSVLVMCVFKTKYIQAQGKVEENGGKIHPLESPLFWQCPWRSERLVVPDREVSLWGRSTGWTLVHALGAGALVLLFRAGAGGDCGGGGGGGTSLLLKVCYDDCDVAHRDGQLLGCAPVDVLQLGPVEVEKKYSAPDQWDLYWTA